jgi:hypothetical protein
MRLPLFLTSWIRQGLRKFHRNPSARSICDDVARPPGKGRAFQHDLREGHWVLVKIAFNSLRDLCSRRGNLYVIFTWLSLEYQSFNQRKGMTRALPGGNYRQKHQ